MKNEIKKVGIWLRVSTQQQVTETESLKHHQIRAEAYCQAKGWKIVKVYKLEGLSGKSVMKYSQTLEMLSDIENGIIDTLVFSSLSRLARNTKQLLSISDTFQKYGASMVSLKEAIDTTSPAGRMFFTVQSSLATFESEEISERVKASVKTRAKLGKSLGGVAQFGYRWNDSNTALELDPKESPIRKEAFTIFLDCKRIKTTARILNERGYRTRKGAKFGYSTVKTILTNPLSKGLRRANYFNEKENSKLIKPESEWIYTKAPAVVSEEIFDKVAQIIKDNARPTTRKARLPVHPFSGTTYCGCDRANPVKMRILSSIPDKYTCPKCRAKIPKDDLEQVYKSQLKNLKLTPKQLSDYAKSVDKTLTEKAKLLEIAKSEFSKISAKSQKFLDLYVDDKLSKDAFGRCNDPLDKQLTELGKTIPELEELIENITNQVKNESRLIYNSETLYEKWDSLSDVDKTKTISSLTQSIVVSDNKVEINLHFIPTVLNGGHLAPKPPPTKETAEAEW